MPIRVLIVDDHAVVRTGLRLLLDREEDIEVVAGGRSVHPTLGARLAQAEVEAARRAANDPLSGA